MVDRALHAINASVGEGMNRDEMEILRAQSFCPELREQPIIRDLFGKTPLFDIAESLLGKDNAKYGRGQIALRFPLHQDPPRAPGWHIDGVPTATNGVTPGGLDSFTMLVAVLLSDLPQENMGNFSVWPRSHRVLEEFFQQRSFDDFQQESRQLDLGTPQQITGKAGDVVICHYQMAHGIAPNTSPFVRYAVFFRVKHPQHNEQKPQQLSNLWLEWPGIDGGTAQ
jgi:hypothetical protein